MKKALYAQIERYRFRRKLKKLDARHTLSEKRISVQRELALFGKKELVKIIGLVVLSIIILLEVVSIASGDFLTGAPAAKSRISGLLQEQQTLASIDAERRATQAKIVNIISRYNKNMGDEQKYNIAREIYSMSHKYPNLNVDFICATITHESAKTWDPRVVSKVGALGLMQIMPATGAFLAAQERIEWSSPEKVLTDPIVNIRLGCRYLSDLVSMYQHDGGLAAYNGGPKRAAIWLASNRNDENLVSETRDYIPAVLKLYDQFRTEGVM